MKVLGNPRSWDGARFDPWFVVVDMRTDGSATVFYKFVTQCLENCRRLEVTIILLSLSIILGGQLEKVFLFFSFFFTFESIDMHIA